MLPIHRTTLALLFFSLCLPSTLRAELILAANFVDNGVKTWDAITRGVVNQAISDWRQVISGVNGTTQSISFSVQFSNVGTSSYLGQWQGGFSASNGASVRPWSSGVNHNIFFNAAFLDAGLSNKLWFDPTPTTSNDQPQTDWDALSVARHEIGHMLGFTTLYRDNVFNPDETNPWTSRIVNNVFDPNGLNVAMDADNSHLGTAIGNLMSPSLLNGTRLGISNTEASMLSLAYGYDITAVPEPSSILLLCFLIPIFYRHRCRKRAAVTALATATG